MKQHILAVTALSTSLLILGSAGAAAAKAYKGFAVTGDNNLVSFKTKKAHKSVVVAPLSGFSGGDTTLVGIDRRVQDGLLYGVGDNGGIYTIDTATGALTQVSALTVALSGTTFGVDFNPAADRLRVISDDGQNLRHNLNDDTTVADTALSFTVPPATPVVALGVTGAAYTNNDLDGSTATTLFDVDATADRVAVQSPANAGLLAPTGNLGADANAAAGVGADIFTGLDEGITESNVMFAVASVGGMPTLHEVDLLTGRATVVRIFNLPVFDIALDLDE